MLTPIYLRSFEDELEKAKKCGYDMEKIKDVMNNLIKEKPLAVDLLCNLIYLLKSPFFRLFDPLLRCLLTRVCLTAEYQKAEKIIDFFR